MVGYFQFISLCLDVSRPTHVGDDGSTALFSNVSFLFLAGSFTSVVFIYLVRSFFFNGKVS